MRKATYLIVAFTLMMFGTMFMITFIPVPPITAQEEDTLEWRNAGCPVYRSECGSKHTYRCERRATVVGRNKVGDIFVDAYPICGAKK